VRVLGWVEYLIGRVYDHHPDATDSSKTAENGESHLSMMVYGYHPGENDFRMLGEDGKFHLTVKAFDDHPDQFDCHIVVEKEEESLAEWAHAPTSLAVQKLLVFLAMVAVQRRTEHDPDHYDYYRHYPDLESPVCSQLYLQMAEHREIAVGFHSPQLWTEERVVEWHDRLVPLERRQLLSVWE
jgi:hypothetical protein